MSWCRAAALGPLVAAGAVHAQDSVPADAAAATLDGLLGQLAKTGGAAWEARVEALRAAATAATNEAAAHRKAAEASEAVAKGETDAAMVVEGEVARLEALRQALATMKFRDPAGQGESAKTPQGQLEVSL
ncbi:MAG: hypothetical protein ACO3UM_14005, partial [Planctomycetota bacterium]